MIPSLVRNLETAFLTVLPHGGQRSARQNAWASMSADSALARSRREAEAAMDRAQLRARARELAAQ